MAIRIFTICKLVDWFIVSVNYIDIILCVVFVKCSAWVCEKIGIDLQTEPKRVYHVSLANLTGSPMDSVGHSEENPITNGAVRLLL